VCYPIEIANLQLNASLCNKFRCYWKKPFRDRFRRTASTGSWTSETPPLRRRAAMEMEVGVKNGASLRLHAVAAGTNSRSAGAEVGSPPAELRDVLGALDRLRLDQKALGA
jgi:hypothetical protein